MGTVLLPADGEWWCDPRNKRRNFQPSAKSKTRYSTLGFKGGGPLDDGSVWPVAYAIQDWTPAVEKRVTALINQALA